MSTQNLLLSVASIRIESTDGNFWHTWKSSHSHSHCHVYSSHSHSHFWHIFCSYFHGNPIRMGIPVPCTSLQQTNHKPLRTADLYNLIITWRRQTKRPTTRTNEQTKTTLNSTTVCYPNITAIKPFTVKLRPVLFNTVIQWTVSISNSTPLILP